MLLKDFIKELQRQYDNETSDPEYLEMMGEPEIMIDVFKKCENPLHEYQYVGFDKEVLVERSGDGVYLILNRFSKNENSTNNS